ncbi:MAG: class I SAM-dependent methyltransferase [Roseomonas sp.]|nr:class I SAM-dependent methyltransferase [Roseomonas sp.]
MQPFFSKTSTILARFVSARLSSRQRVEPDASTFSTSNLAVSYDHYFQSGLYGRRYPRFNPNVANLVQGLVTQGAIVLDFGCGDGRYIDPLLDAGASVIGYDISSVALESLSERYQAAIESGRLRTVGYALDALERQVKPASCDLVLLLFGVLGHIRGDAQRIATLRALRTLLRPGGRLVVTVPNRRRRFGREQAACRDLISGGNLEEGDIFYQRREAGVTIDMFYHLFSLENFEDLLARAGFAVERMLPESMMPERSVIQMPAGAALDRALMGLLPLHLAYGFAAVASPSDVRL